MELKRQNQMKADAIRKEQNERRAKEEAARKSQKEAAEKEVSAIRYHLLCLADIYLTYKCFLLLGFEEANQRTEG
jgi:hypothetical protein